jgi:hypothetical protein
MHIDISKGERRQMAPHDARQEFKGGGRFGKRASYKIQIFFQLVLSVV